MKILFICENYLPHYGGAEVVFKNLAERYVKKGHQVTILTHLIKGCEKKERINGVNVVRVPAWHSRYLFSFTSIPQAIKLAKWADIIQTTSFNGAPPAWLAGKVTKKKVVITVHEVWAGKWQEVTGFSWFKSSIHNLLEKMIYKLPFDKYICVSQATKHNLAQLGVQDQKTVIIHNGLDYKFWNPTNFTKKDLPGFTYFSWGRPGPSKGFEYLIKAVPLIRREVPNARFLLMLSEIKMHQRKRELLQAQAQAVGVEVLPQLPYQELGNYLISANCAIIPSLAEGFGYTTVEAAALDIPVVVSDAGSLREVVSGKHQIFRSKDASDLAKKAIMASKGEFLNKPRTIFNWDDKVDAYLEVYNHQKNSTS
jgi:glycosyltransferase involved in cell wall biosynthesis